MIGRHRGGRHWRGPTRVGQTKVGTGMTTDQRDFFGLPLDLRRQDQLANDICKRIEGGGCFHHLSLNAVKLVLARRNPKLRDALCAVDCVSADGMGVVWAARFIGIAVPERVTGIDLMDCLLTRFSQTRHSVFLLGARDDVIDRLKDRLVVDYPGLVIAGAHHGYDPDDARLADSVRASGADAVFVALPSPRKDVFVRDYGQQTGCRFVMAVGGAFDVMVGDIARAPKIWQRCGMEFAWRILAAPRVMAPRYARGLWSFAGLAVPEILRWQSRRFMRVVGMLLVLVMVFSMMPGRGDAQNQMVVPAVDRDMADQRAKALMGFLAEDLRDPAKTDGQSTIDALVARLVGFSADASGRETAPEDRVIAVDDFRLLFLVLDRLLSLAQLVAPGGTGSFLLELVVMKAALRLVELHPDPAQAGRLLQSFAPGMSRRLRARGLFDAGGRIDPDVSGNNAQADLQTTSGNPSVPRDLYVRFARNFAQNPASLDALQEAPVWGAKVDVDLDFEFEQPSVSPR